MPNGMPQRTKIRYATNINSGDHVVLKFYPNFEASEAAIQAHRWIRKSERVCKYDIFHILLSLIALKNVRNCRDRWFSALYCFRAR